MLLKNLDVNKKLINGMRGTVTDIVENNNNIGAIFVKFDSQAKNESSIPITRTIISQETVLGHKMTVKQFPLRLAWAITAHKAQGQTLQKVAISLDSKSFAHGAFYVALSRVKRLENILLFGNMFPNEGIKFHTNLNIKQMEITLDDEIN